MAKELLVSAAAGGQKLFNFLKRATTGENAEIHRWIRTGQVRINKKRADAFDIVKEGDCIRIPPFAQTQPGACTAEQLPNSEAAKTADNRQNRSDTPIPPKQTAPLAEYSAAADKNFPFTVLFENKHLLVIDKAPGIACQGGTGQKENIADMLKAYFKNAPFVPAPAHRLDKETQGILLICKSYACLRFLTECMKGDERTLKADMQKAPKKIYRAWVYGDITDFAEKTPYLCTYLFHNETEKKEQVFSAHKVHGAQDAQAVLQKFGICRKITADSRKTKALFALSALKVLRTKTHNGKTVSLAEIGIYTGRKHQIRAQLAHFGFALVGDKKYAPQKFLRENDRFFLQACQITLPENEFTEQTVFTL